MTTREEIFNGTVFYAYRVCTREAWFYKVFPLSFSALVLPFQP